MRMCLWKIFINKRPEKNILLYSIIFEVGGCKKLKFEDQFVVFKGSFLPLLSNVNLFISI